MAVMMDRRDFISVMAAGLAGANQKLSVSPAGALPAAADGELQCELSINGSR